MAGIRTVPLPAASATPEPDIPAMIMFVTTTTWASPPRMWPTSVLAKSTSRSVIPPVFMRLPARMKKGMARRGKVSIPPISPLDESLEGNAGAEGHVDGGRDRHGPADGHAQREQDQHDDEEPDHSAYSPCRSAERRLPAKSPSVCTKMSAAETGTTMYTT